MVALFAVDIAFKFRLAYYDDELLIDDARAIALRYVRCATGLLKTLCVVGLHSGFITHAASILLNCIVSLACTALCTTTCKAASTP